MGFKKDYGAIERTNYLFHNLNTKKLNVQDRQKLSYVLKAFDENFQVTVNKAIKQLIFPPTPPAPRPVPQTAAPAEKTQTSVRFSSPQKMSSESKDGLQPYRITPFDTNSNKDKPGPEDRGLGKNVVNLRK
jgi:hypothetical protein